MEHRQHWIVCMFRDDILAHTHFWRKWEGIADGSECYKICSICNMFGFFWRGRGEMQIQLELKMKCSEFIMYSVLE